MSLELDFELSLSNLPKQPQREINMMSERIGVNGDQISLLGIEDFYGNVWEFIHGFYVKDDGYYIAKFPSQLGDITQYTHYPATPVMGANPNDYREFYFKNVEKIGMFNIPRTTGGNDKQYYTDYFWSHRKEQTNICLAGGSWVYARLAGAFCLILNRVASFADSNVCARLIYRPKR